MMSIREEIRELLKGLPKEEVIEYLNEEGFNVPSNTKEKGSSFEILEDNEETIQKFHDKGWGANDCYITSKDIEALRQGKCIGHFDGEYTHVLKLAK
jgi:hypothetical protein